MSEKFSNYTLGKYQPKQFSYNGNSYKWESLTDSEIAMLAEDPNFNPIFKATFKEPENDDSKEPGNDDSKESGKRDSKGSTK